MSFPSSMGANACTHVGSFCSQVASNGRLQQDQTRTRAQYYIVQNTHFTVKKFFQICTHKNWKDGYTLKCFSRRSMYFFLHYAFLYYESILHLAIKKKICQEIFCLNSLNYYNFKLWPIMLHTENIFNLANWGNTGINSQGDSQQSQLGHGWDQYYHQVC